MVAFVGRRDLLARLEELQRSVARQGSGSMLSVRGRRQVGKSRLIEEFVARSGAPAVYFTCTQHAAPENERQTFVGELATSGVPALERVRDATFAGWEPLLRFVAGAIDRPTILVIDELPYLLAGDVSLEGTLQKVWDRWLSRVPVLLILIGSDVSTMAMLSAYDRPLHQRLQELVVEPFTPLEIAELLGLEPRAAFDAYLVVGGFPRVAQLWRRGTTLRRFLTRELRSAASPLVVVGERVLSAEFPVGLQARDVLLAVGAGERTFTTIRQRSGLNEGSLHRTLKTLVEAKRVVEEMRPLGGGSGGGAALYHVADPYLRFWLRFLAPHLDLLLRDRADLVIDKILAAWPDYRGRAIEPLVRRSLERLLPDPRLGEARYVGAFWDRAGTVQVDLVAAEASRTPSPVGFVGSIKWREREPFGERDLAELVKLRALVPGAGDCALVGVSRSGFVTRGLDAAFEASDLLAAWGERRLPARRRRRG